MATAKQNKPSTEGSVSESGIKVEDNVTHLFKQEDPDFMQKLTDGAAKIARIAGERKELNAEIAEVMASFENEGLNRHAAKAAMKYVDMNEKDQLNYDLTYNVMRKALGKPVQGDLFEAAVASEIRDNKAAH